MKQINVAIIEDVKDNADTLLWCIDNFGARNNVTFVPYFFSSAELFLNPSKNVYDIIFLDIELPGMNGFDLAKKIRSFDKKVIFIFVTNIKKYVIHGYEVDALNYILKPFSQAAIDLTLTKAVHLLERENAGALPIKCDGKVKVIPFSEICYIEILKHDVILETIDGSYEFYGNLTEIEKKLDQSLFCRCSASTIVGYKYIQEINKNELIIKGHRIPISRSKKKDFMERFINYYG